MEHIRPHTPVFHEQYTEWSSPVIGNCRINNIPDQRSELSPLIQNCKNTSPNRQIDLSPVLGNYTNNTYRYYSKNSPVLHTKRLNSQSDSELETSPVINRNRKKIIRLGQSRLSLLKKQENCVRQLTELQAKNTNTSKYEELTTAEETRNTENRIKKVCEWMKDKENYEIDEENSQPSPKETEVSSNVSKASHKNGRLTKSWININEYYKKISDHRYSNKSELSTKQSVTNKWINIRNKFDDFRETNRTNDEQSVETESIKSQDLLGNNSPPSVIVNDIEPVTKAVFSFNKYSASPSYTLLEPLLTNKFPATNEPTVINSSRITAKYERKKVGQNKRPSRPLYSQSESVEIEMVSSQDGTSVSETIATISDVSSPKPEVTGAVSKAISPQSEYKIEVSSSQTSSVPTINSNYTVVQDSPAGSSYETLYNSPKRTRKYKPGTLCHQMHKLLRRQKADTGIWRHELYLSHTSGYQIPATTDDHLITTLQISTVFNDFGCSVFECMELMCTSPKCFVIANLTWSKDVVIEVGAAIRIYPPYVVKYFNIRNEESVKTFVNVHKIVRIKN